jgi:hypothetical protein
MDEPQVSAIWLVCEKSSSDCVQYIRLIDKKKKQTGQNRKNQKLWQLARVLVLVWKW